MHSISFNILNEAGPIARGTSRLSIFNFKKLKIWFINSIVEVLTNNIEKQLDKLILLCEGMFNHLKDLNMEDAKAFYKDVQSVINLMDKTDEGISEFHYLEKKDLQHKMRYSLKLLYRLEAQLEMKIYKNESQSSDSKETNESEDIKRAIADLGHRSVSQTLKREED